MCYHFQMCWADKAPSLKSITSQKKYNVESGWSTTILQGQWILELLSTGRSIMRQFDLVNYQGKHGGAVNCWKLAVVFISFHCRENDAFTFHFHVIWKYILSHRPSCFSMFSDLFLLNSALSFTSKANLILKNGTVEAPGTQHCGECNVYQ